MELFNLALIFALHSTFFLFLFWGIYILKLNPKKPLNLSFFFLCIALSIWAIGFALASVQNSVTLVLLWRRFAAIGWTMVYGLLVHFLYLLTKTKRDNKSEILIYLIHLPGLFFAYIFSFSSSISVMQYNLVKAPYAWINIALNTPYDYLFYGYYGVYMVASIIMVWQWKEQQGLKKRNREFFYIFLALISALVLGSLSDFWLNLLFKTQVAQLGPLVFIVPLGTIYHAARYHGLFEKLKYHENELILTKSNQKIIFNRLGWIFIFGGIFALGSETLPQSVLTQEILVKSIVRASIIASFGLLLLINQQFKVDTKREMINNGILLMSIPAINLAYLDQASVSVWMISILIMTISLVFNKRFLLLSSAMVGIITQRIIWMIRPETVVFINEFDFILRIGLLISAFLLSVQINRIYLARLKEIAYQTSFQQINAKLSSDFISINQDNFEVKVKGLLKELGLFFTVDRTYLFLINQKNQTMTYNYEWCENGIEPEVETIKDEPLEVFSWWLEQLEDHGLVYIADVGDMPLDALEEQQQLLRQKIKSLVAVPVKDKGELIGFIGIDSVKEKKVWTDENIKLLNILANLLSIGMIKVKAEKESSFMAYYDPLTSLPNRNLFQKYLKQSIKDCRSLNSYCSVIFLDLDNFKSVNDTMGHKGGDDLLVEVTHRIQKILHCEDTLARFGGDEFLLLINSAKNKAQVDKIAQEIMNVFTLPFRIQNQDFFVTCSAGIAQYPIDGEDSQSLIKNADTAMYAIKYNGKNQYAFCTTKMKNQVYKEMVLSNDLNHALENNELEVYYQPQINLFTGQISGVEALLRWNHPKLGGIPPNVFIPLAEKTGLINSMGHWVLQEACLKNKEWQDQRFCFVPMAVNLSSVQFTNHQIVEQIRDILKFTGLKPEFLEVEITESTAIKELEYGFKILKKLNEIGITIAIDDFGTEYSSLSRLKNLPIDRLKIDIEFIAGIGENKKDEAITKIIINLAKSLGLKVIAEGAENLKQVTFLEKELCDDVQGYYFYRPMKGTDMDKLLEGQKNQKMLIREGNQNLTL